MDAASNTIIQGSVGLGLIALTNINASGASQITLGVNALPHPPSPLFYLGFVIFVPKAQNPPIAIPNVPQRQPLPLQGPTLPTPIDIEKLTMWLKGYEGLEFLREGFTKGFDIGFVGDQPLAIGGNGKNLISADQHPEVVDTKLGKEIQKGRIMGPFDTPPFDPFILSPIGVVPKKNEGEFRMIQHLSFPDGASVNSHIEESFKIVHYQNIDDAVSVLRQAGKGAFLAKCDIASAFRIIPLRPDQYHLFGFKWKNKFYFDRCLHMGCSSSCQIFETLSTALHWIALVKLAIEFLVHYLDDFLLIHPSKSICQKQLDLFSSMCDHCGVPIAPEKTVEPTQRLTFLGYEFDSVEMLLRLPLDKLETCRMEIHNILQRNKAQLKELQSIIGTLNFACGAIVPGRPFLRRLINLTIGIKLPHHFVRITKAVKEDLWVWVHFLQEFNGKSLLLPDIWLSSHNLFLFTDAASSGYAGFCAQQWFQGKWSDAWRQQSIEVLELYPICIAVELWTDKLANRCIQFHTDNSALVPIINDQTSKSKEIMVLVRRLVLHCLKHNILFKAYHIAGYRNGIADSLSRFQMQRFRELAPHAHTNPVEVPPLPESPS